MTLRLALIDNPRGSLMVALYRVANRCSIARKRGSFGKLWSAPFLFMYRFITEIMLGYEIPAATKIGVDFFIDHGYGIVINKHAVIGDRCRIKHHVTIGCKTESDGSQGPSPVIGDDVDIGAGAVIIGDIRVGSRVRIGAAAVVTKDVPDDAIVVGNPGKVLLRGPAVSS